MYRFRLNVHAHFPRSTSVKNLPASAGDIRDVGSIPGLGISPGEGNGNPHSILAWRIPWTEKTVGLQSLGSQRVRHDWSDLAYTLNMWVCGRLYFQKWPQQYFWSWVVFLILALPITKSMCMLSLWARGGPCNGLDRWDEVEMMLHGFQAQVIKGKMDSPGNLFLSGCLPREHTTTLWGSPGHMKCHVQVFWLVASRGPSWHSALIAGWVKGWASRWPQLPGFEPLQLMLQEPKPVSPSSPAQMEGLWAQ